MSLKSELCHGTVLTLSAVIIPVSDQRRRQIVIRVSDKQREDFHSTDYFRLTGVILISDTLGLMTQ